MYMWWQSRLETIRHRFKRQWAWDGITRVDQDRKLQQTRSKTNRKHEQASRRTWETILHRMTKIKHVGRFSHHSDAEYNLNERLKQFTWTKSYRNRHERGYKRGIKVKQYRIKDWNKNPGQIVFVTSSQHLTDWKEVIEEMKDVISIFVTESFQGLWFSCFSLVISPLLLPSDIGMFFYSLLSNYYPFSPIIKLLITSYQQKRVTGLL